MPDNYVLIGLGCAALLVVWLVYSLVKKAMGLALLGGLVVAGFFVWNNPELQQMLIGMALDVMGAG